MHQAATVKAVGRVMDIPEKIVMAAAENHQDYVYFMSKVGAAEFELRDKAVLEYTLQLQGLDQYRHIKEPMCLYKHFGL